MVPLESLQPDEGGRIVLIEGHEATVHRLEEMGLREGAAVRMVRAGRPCIVRVNDHRLSLRTSDDVLILVELGAE